MKYPEFIEGLKSKMLSKDEDYWVCIYVVSIEGQKSVTPPTKARLKVTPLKHAYHSVGDFSFQPYGKSGKVLNRLVPGSKVYSYGASYSDFEIFLSEKDCYERFLTLCEEAKELVEKEKERLIQKMDTIQAGIEENIRLATERKLEMGSSY